MTQTQSDILPGARGQGGPPCISFARGGQCRVHSPPAEGGGGRRWGRRGSQPYFSSCPPRPSASCPPSGRGRRARRWFWPPRRGSRSSRRRCPPPWWCRYQSSHVSSEFRGHCRFLEVTKLLSPPRLLEIPTLPTKTLSQHQQYKYNKQPGDSGKEEIRQRGSR